MKTGTISVQAKMAGPADSVAAPGDRRHGGAEFAGGHRTASGQGRRRVGAALFCLGLFALAGCSLLPPATPDLTRYYVLTSPVPPTPAADAGPERPARVMLKSVIVPEFLRGRIMPVRVANNEVHFVDEARWAEPLEPGLTRVVRDGLAQAASIRVVARGGDEHDFDVTVRLRDCEGVLPAGVARLAARIEIFSTELDPQLVAQEEFSTDIAGWDGKDFGALAQKLSEAAAELAGRIAAAVPARKK